MKSGSIGVGTLAAAAAALCAAVTWSAAPPQPQAAKEGMAGHAEKPGGAGRVSVAEARERAKLMHEIHAATLESLHRHYFRHERAVLPARAMEDVFADLDKAAKVRTRWIAVNTRPMSVDHKPQAGFEEDAAEALANGKAAFERVGKGYYHRAGAIPLGTSCVGCHTRFGAPTTKKPRVAGLVISIPLEDQ